MIHKWNQAFYSPTIYFLFKITFIRIFVILIEVGIKTLYRSSSRRSQSGIHIVCWELRVRILAFPAAFKLEK